MTDNDGMHPDAHSAPEESSPNPDFGVLLGWTAERLGDRVVLRVQSAQKALGVGEEPRQITYFLKQEQAVLLGNYLCQIAGVTPPASRTKGRLARLFGKP